MKLASLIEDKKSEIKKLEDEYLKLNQKSFANLSDIKRMEEIYRTLFTKYGYVIPSEKTGWSKEDKPKSSKFKKTQRVTNFTRDRR